MAATSAHWLPYLLHLVSYGVLVSWASGAPYNKMASYDSEMFPSVSSSWLLRDSPVPEASPHTALPTACDDLRRLVRSSRGDVSDLDLLGVELLRLCQRADQDDGQGKEEGERRPPPPSYSHTADLSGLLARMLSQRAQHRQPLEKRRWGDTVTSCIQSNCNSLTGNDRIQCIVQQCQRKRDPNFRF